MAIEMNFPDSSTHNQDSRFQALLDEGRDMVLVFLSAQLNDLFNSTDEALLDFAEQAESNAIQSRFFEAIGAVRKYHAEVEFRFREEIRDGFDKFLQPPAPPHNQKISPEELALMEREDMDESVAVEDLITQFRRNYFMQLYALGLRLAVLNQGRKVPEKEIPAGPPHVVNAFRVSIHALDIDSKAKIVLYALFGKFVMRHLQGMYDEFNDNLKNADILPNLKSPFVTSQSRAPRPPQNEEQHKDTQSATEGGGGMERMSGTDAGAQASLGEDLFGSILHLLAAGRHSPSAAAHGPAAQRAETGGDAAAGAVGSPGGTAGVASREGAVVSREQLVSTIDSIRPRGVGQGRGVLSDLESLPKVAVDPNFLDTLKGVITSEREEIFSQLPPEQIQGIDADIIDLIGMLFEYMLDDPLLPNLAKALLSHLHTPYLKMSLTDSTLLVDSEHPARVLFDLLVGAGAQWVYENDINRGIFPQMQIVVDRVLKEFTENDELLPELLEYFLAAMDEYRRKSETIEQRAQESVKGREKLQVAKQRAAREIHNRSQHVRLPRSAERFLTQTWTDSLAFILLRQEEGELSEEWNHALQIADELIWLFGPEGAEAGEKEIRQVGSAVQEEIEKALESLGGYHQRYLNKLFEFLSSPAAMARWHEKHTETPYSEPLVSDAESLLESAVSPSDMGEEASGQPGFEPFGQPPLFGEATSEREVPLTEPEWEMLEQLQRLQFGTWFEFRGKDNETRRLKLSWLSPVTATCMFVDKSGAQAQIKTLADTARMMVSGDAKIMPKPKQQFVERAMLAIKKTLQRSMRATN